MIAVTFEVSTGSLEHAVNPNAMLITAKTLARDLRILDKASPFVYPLGYHKVMKIEAAELKAVRDRLVRAQGQIGGIVKMIDEGRDCAELLNQLAAANSAVHKAGFALISVGMANCASDSSGDADRASLEKAFMSLA